MTDAEILRLFQSQFGSIPRPEKFTCEDGDPECMDKDALLHSRTPETLKLEDVNNPSYDVWTECLVQGKAYYLPAMVRLALEQQESEEEWYPALLAGHLGQDRALFDFCGADQRSAILDFLNHLLSTRKTMGRWEWELRDMTEARDRWRRAINGCGFTFGSV